MIYQTLSVICVCFNCSVRSVFLVLCVQLIIIIIIAFVTGGVWVAIPHSPCWFHLWHVNGGSGRKPNRKLWTFLVKYMYFSNNLLTKILWNNKLLVPLSQKWASIPQTGPSALTNTAWSPILITPGMTYYVSSGTLNSTNSTLTLFIILHSVLSRTGEQTCDELFSRVSDMLACYRPRVTSAVAEKARDAPYYLEMSLFT